MDEYRGSTLQFEFQILEVTEIDDIGQSLTIPMYLNMTWPDRRLWINQEHPAWNEDTHGPINVSKLFLPLLMLLEENECERED